MHGGSTPRGSESANFRHGRRSQYMASLGEYQRILDEPMELMNLLHQLAGMEILMEKAVNRAAEKDVPAFRAQALDRFRELKDAMQTDDVSEIARCLRAMGELLHAGVSADRAESHLAQIIERFSKRVEEAWKIRTSTIGRIDPDAFKSALGMMVTIVQQEAHGLVGARILERFHSEIVDGSPAITLPGSSR